MSDRMSDSQRKYIEENFRTKSDKELAETLGIKKKAVRKALKSMGLERTKEEIRRFRGPGLPQGEEAPAKAAGAKGWIHVLLICIIIIATSMSYANSLKNDFIWDDEFLVRDNLYIRSSSHIKEMFTSYLASSSGNINNFYRPIQDLSYAIDYFLWGDNPMGYHLTNLILHALCAVLVYILILRIFESPMVGFIAGLLFGIHPINTEAVTYVAGRADSLYCLFFLFSFVLFLKTLDGFKKDFKINWNFYIPSIFFYALSILSKEIGIILPLMLLLYHTAFLDNARIKNRVRSLYIPYILVFLVYLFMRKTMLDFSGAAPSFVMARYPLYQRLLTTSKAIIVYLRLIILPLGLHMERTIKVARSLFEPEALGAVIAIIAISLATFNAYKRRLKKVFFAIMWFFVGLIPVSNIVPINSFIAEHWIYLSAIGIFAMIGMGIVFLSKRKAGKVLSILIVLSLSVFYMHLTIERNKGWKDEVTFFKETLKYSPNNARLHLNFGNTYLELGNKKEAIEEYRKAIKLRPDDAIAYGNIGTAHMGLGRHKEAQGYIEKALSIKPDFPDALYNLGVIYEQMGYADKAEKNFKDALKYNPRFLNCHMRLGSICLNRGDVEKAKEHWREALKINPKEKDAKRLLDRY